jgi:hypothetical protein
MNMNEFAARYGIRAASLIIKTATNSIEDQTVVECLTELANDLESAMRQYCLDNREAILRLVTEKVEENAL